MRREGAVRKIGIMLDRFNALRRAIFARNKRLDPARLCDLDRRDFKIKIIPVKGRGRRWLADPF